MKFIFYALFFSFITQITMAQNSDIQPILQSVAQKYAPDKRTEIFEIRQSIRKDTLVLSGKTSSREAHRELVAKLKAAGKTVKDNIVELPKAELGEKVWGVVYNSVGTLRYAPAYSSEMVTQALLGTPIRVLEKKGGWLRVQTPDKYIGWMNGALRLMTKKELSSYLTQNRIIILAISTQSYEKPDVKSQVVSDLVAGNMLVQTDKTGEFYKVSYPDGRIAYVHTSDAQPVAEWHQQIVRDGESIVKTAFRFVGLPYTWGGTSSKGVDCSGFTKSVYFMHGIILARDASQQVRYGKLIDKKGDFTNAQPGDLVFFGDKATDKTPHERVVHVGIYLGNRRFIHASDYVHVGSFDPKDPLYDAYNTNRYLRTKRVLGEVNTRGIEDIFANEFYK